jgi:hypothetical protein
MHCGTVVSMVSWFIRTSIKNVVLQQLQPQAIRMTGEPSE